MGDLGLILNQKLGPIGNTVTSPVAPFVVNQGDFGVSGHDHLNVLAVFNRGTVLELGLAVNISLDP